MSKMNHEEFIARRTVCKNMLYKTGETNRGVIFEAMCMFMCEQIIGKEDCDASFEEIKNNLERIFEYGKRHYKETKDE